MTRAWGPGAGCRGSVATVARTDGVQIVTRWDIWAEAKAKSGLRFGSALGQEQNCAPLAAMVDPLMNSDSSEARKATTRALTSGRPTRPAGVWPMTAPPPFPRPAMTLSVPR